MDAKSRALKKAWRLKEKRRVKRERTMKRLLGPILPITIVLFVVFHVISHFYMGFISKRWPSTRGKIINVSIEKNYHKDTETGRIYYTYSPIIKYIYWVNGSQYNGERIRYGPRKSYRRQSKAKKILEKYPVDTSLAVFYKPTDPSSSVIEKGISWSLYFLFVIVICLMIGIYRHFFEKPNKPSHGTQKARP